MSISSSTNKFNYVLTSTTQALPFPTLFITDDDIKVFRSRNSVDVQLSKSTHYNVTGAGEEDGGTVTMTGVDVLVGDTITLLREVAFTQVVDFVNHDRFPAATHERALDKLTMMAQQLNETAERSIQFPKSEVAGGGNIMPAAAVRAAKILGFDATGNTVQLYDPVSVAFASGDAIYANTVAALKSVDVTGLLNGQQVHVAGYSAAGDGGGGQFVYVSASSATENTGTIIAPNAGSGRWFRVYSGPVSVHWFGAKGDGVTNDSVAIAAAINSGAKEIGLSPFDYFAGAPINVTVSDVKLIGYGANIVRAASLGSGSVLTATSQTDLSFEGIKFSVGIGTPHTATGGFITLTSCHNISFSGCKFSGKIPGAGTQKESLITLVSLPGCNDVTAVDCDFEYSYGNAIGANDVLGTGLNGKRHRYIANRFYNCVDTSLGIWTNASDVSVVGNKFLRDDYSTSFNSVGIDVAGATNVSIVSNIFSGGVMQIRVIQNLNYTNLGIIIDSNTFTNQANGPSESGQAIKIAHSTNTDAASRAADIRITNNSFIMAAAMWGVDIVSTVADTSKYLTLQVDRNTFNITAAGSYGIIFQKSGASGAIRFIPGTNAFIGTGGIATAGNYPNTMTVDTSIGEVGHRSGFQFTGTTQANLVAGACERGFYCVNLWLGTCTDVVAGGTLLLQAKSGGYLPVNTPVSAGATNYSGTLMFNHVLTSEPHALTFAPHPAGNTHNYNYLSLIRVI